MDEAIVVELFLEAALNRLMCGEYKENSLQWSHKGNNSGRYAELADMHSQDLGYGDGRCALWCYDSRLFELRKRFQFQWPKGAPLPGFRPFPTWVSRVGD